jgi:hypothetical protein
LFFRTIFSGRQSLLGQGGVAAPLIEYREASIAGGSKKSGFDARDIERDVKSE